MTAERPRKAVSLCSLAKSIWNKAEFNGTFKDPPVEGVMETPATVALKERTFVFAGAAKGMARSVRASVALLLPPGMCPGGTPLQEVIEKAAAQNQKDDNFLTLVRQPIRGMELPRPLTQPHQTARYPRSSRTSQPLAELPVRPA